MENLNFRVQIKNGLTWNFTRNGQFVKNLGECLLFPSRDNRDWSTFKVDEVGFKVGDYIKDKHSGEVYVLVEQEKPSKFLANPILLSSSQSFQSIIVYKDAFGDYEKVEKFDQSFLKPFDKILVRDTATNWFVSFFSHLTDDYYPYVLINGCSYKYCIPYNEETKHIIGTKEDAPEFYRI